MKTRVLAVLSTGLLTPGLAQAHGPEALFPGSVVGVEIRVNQNTTPLYNAVDGSGRYYFEARPGAPYEVVLTNRSGTRVGADVDVDGLNVISGERDRPGSPGRMYILDPWESTTIRGWRTSLDAVKRFTFVDEKRSYAARSGKANEKMGWVEIAVYRERRPRAFRAIGPHKDAESDRYEGDARPGAPASPEASSEGKAEAAGAVRERSQGYPGTGWGERAEDRAHVVAFDYEPSAVQNVTLRYEYAAGLVALGIVPESHYGRNRLRDRDRGRAGFAQPPSF